MPELGTIALDLARAQDFCNRQWDDELIGLLSDYIRVPAKSPAFDPDWETRGLLDQVVNEAAAWARRQPLPGLRVEVLRTPGRTPLIYFELPARGCDTDEAVFFYGHLDKQPEFEGWRPGLGPWEPVYDGTRLYGRGGADDGYAIYAAITALQALHDQGATHPRCVGVIETCEESGSYDLPHYLEVLQPRIGKVGLVVCLDSGAGDYERLWLVSSLRGYCGGTLEVQVLDEGAHSGDAGGIVPSSFRVLRGMLDRLEDSATGRLLPATLHCEVPADRLAQTREAARILGEQAWKRFRWHCGEDGQPALPVTTDPEQALLNRAWRPSLAVIGAEGLPALQGAGNVLRPRTAFRLSLRLPPLVDSASALAEVKRVLEDSPPYRAGVRFVPDRGHAKGWNAPAYAPWLEETLDLASRACFDGRGFASIGQGGTIPLMGLLGSTYPAAQFMACGVLGPNANAHGPNEFLHVPYAKRLTACLAMTLSASVHAPRRS
ncbi:M20/M25/M40 family metallo-hydrolase [Variovorax dokdonensis]|uniref:M20/M25/M40 family metallo-hydrolase n=1 Tax=Variovorax dokdonensis TaxID=344883 RepID=A0ABT7NE10_9BURK|nr:M20/M25/M40 family metallo-hydrolase [Variovorax dokdonensis]MDM0046187.1 M20/M25/M40 family metallo-hydrolase [Variovorax dokdonensis]